MKTCGYNLPCWKNFCYVLAGFKKNFRNIILQTWCMKFWNYKSKQAATTTTKWIKIKRSMEYIAITILIIFKQSFTGLFSTLGKYFPHDLKFRSICIVRSSRSQMSFKIEFPKNSQYLQERTCVGVSF